MTALATAETASDSARLLPVRPVRPVRSEALPAVVVREQPAPRRLTGIDMWRGVALVLIFITHSQLAPAPLYALTHPFQFDAAMLFIFLSGVVLDLAWRRRWLRDRVQALVGAGQRLLLLYGVHLLLALSLVALLAVLSDLGAEARAPWRLGDPASTETWSALVLLRHQPRLLDILPLYILLLGPGMMLAACTDRWLDRCLVVSALLYTGCQYWGWWPYDSIHGRHLTFSPYAWQFIFVMGMWCHRRRQSVAVWAPRLTGVAWTLAVAYLLYTVARHLDTAAGTGLVPGFLAQKAYAHPFIVANFLAVALLVHRHAPLLERWFGSPTLSWLSSLGRHSLLVFASSTVLAMTLAIVKQEFAPGPVTGVVLLAGGLLALIISGLALRRHEQAKLTR